MVPPPMYPHFCGILIINFEVKTCFHVLVSDVQGGVAHIYFLFFSFGFNFLREVLKVLKLLGTKN